MPVFVPVNPPRDPAMCADWLFEAIKRLNRQASMSTQASAAIIRGETPDGSGNQLVDTGKFFYKPGLSGGQLGYGGINAAENLTLGSTFSGTKGSIFLGTAANARVAFDEANGFLGLGTDTPAVRLHIKADTNGRYSRYEPSTFSVACTVSNGSAVVTGGTFAPNGGPRVVPGMLISGTGIPANTYVKTLDSGTQLTMTNVATAPGTSATFQAYVQIQDKNDETGGKDVEWRSFGGVRFTPGPPDASGIDVPLRILGDPDVQATGATARSRVYLEVGYISAGVATGTDLQLGGPAHGELTYLNLRSTVTTVRRNPSVSFPRRMVLGVNVNSAQYGQAGSGLGPLYAFHVQPSDSGSILIDSISGPTGSTIAINLTGAPTGSSPTLSVSTDAFWQLMDNGVMRMLNGAGGGVYLQAGSDNLQFLRASAPTLGLALVVSGIATSLKTWTVGNYSGIPAVPTDQGTTLQILQAITNGQPIWVNGSTIVDVARTWTTLQKFPDDKFQIIGSVTATKIAQFEADSLPIATNTFTFPNYGGGIIPATAGYGTASANGATTEGQLLRSNGSGVAPTFGNPAFLDSLGTAAETLTVGSAASPSDLIKFRIDGSGTNTLIVPTFGAAHLQTLAFISLAQTWTGLQSFPQSQFQITGDAGTTKLLKFKTDDNTGAFTTTLQTVASGNRTVSLPNVNSSILGFLSETDGQPVAGAIPYGRGSTSSLTSVAIGGALTILKSTGSAPAWSAETLPGVTTVLAGLSVAQTFDKAQIITPSSGTALTLNAVAAGGTALASTYTDNAYAAATNANGVWNLSPTLNDATLGVDATNFLNVSPTVSSLIGNAKAINVSITGNNASLGGSPVIQALTFTATSGGTGTDPWAQLLGLNGNAIHNSTAACTTLTSINASLSTGTSAGTVTSAHGFRVSGFAAGTSSTITNAYCFRGLNPSGSGTIGTLYGLHLPNLTKGGTNWAIFSQGGQSSHLGNFKLGANTAPATALDFADAKDITFGTTTGTKIGAAANQKLAVWGAAPIVQPTAAGAAAAFVTNTSLIANDTATWDGYTIGQVVKALRNIGLLA